LGRGGGHGGGGHDGDPTPPPFPGPVGGEGNGGSDTGDDEDHDGSSDDSDTNETPGPDGDTNEEPQPTGGDEDEDNPGDDNHDGDEPQPTGGENEENPDDDEAKKRMRRKGLLGFFGLKFGGHKRRKNEPNDDLNDGGQRSPEPEPEPEPEPDPSIDGIVDVINKDPEIEEEDKKELTVLLHTKIEELPPEEQSELRQKAEKSFKKLCGIGKMGLAALLAGLLLLNPFTRTTTEGAVAGKRVETRLEMTSPEHDVWHRTPGETTIETEEVTHEKFVPAIDLELGQIVSVAPGTELHFTSFKDSDEYGRVYVVKEGEKFIVNHVAVHQNGNFIGSRSIPDGYSGKIADLIADMGVEGDYDLFVHLAQPEGNGTDQNKDVGWTDIDTYETTVTETVEHEVKGNDTYTPEHIPATYKNETIISEFSGDIANSTANSIEVVNKDGSRANINIRNADGSLVEPGDIVLGDDGCTYRIESISEAENGLHIDAKRALHDLAVVGTGIAALFFLNRRRKKKEAAEASSDSEGTTTTAETGEFREIPVYINLTAEELQNAMKRFSELAADDADTIAQQFAEESGVTQERVAELTESPKDGSVYDGMTPSERTVACTLLSHLHEPSSIDRLSQMLGTDYQEFISSVGINESDIEEPIDDEPDDDTDDDPSDINPEKEAA
ncbi:MAG: hypothetical protein J6Y87_01445, partial [Muribaculaceae bacterium]|nr:hypothetical protein [Muribaculaceae bacterium]